MKRNPKYNCLKSATLTLLAAILLCATFASATLVSAQRLGRPPSRTEVEGTAILPSGASIIPEGTPLIIEMDTRLDSGEARVGDRFAAVIAVPVIDGSGRTVLPSGTRIEGHVTNAQKARWRHRSGHLGLSFDYILLGDGRRIPIRGSLISGRRRIDEEGNLRAKSTTRRDILITAGGAGAGAGIGAATGGALAGGGIGAAAGLTFALLIKGKNVVIDPGDRFNLELVQPLNLASSGFGDSGLGRSRSGGSPGPITSRSGGSPGPITSRSGGSPGPIREPIPLRPRPRPTLRPAPPRQSPGAPTNPNLIRTTSVEVPIYDMRAERGADGYVRVLITAETPTSGWRIYTHHEQRGDTMEIRLRGVPSSNSGIKQVTRAPAPTIIVQDRNGTIRNVLAHGSLGDRYITLGQGSGVAQAPPSTPQPIPITPGTQPPRPRPGSGPSDGSDYSYPAYPPPNPSTGATPRPTSLSALATQVGNSIETLRSNYAAAVGLLINPNGTADPIGQRRTTPNEKQLFDLLTYMLSSARALSAPNLNADDRQRAAQQLRTDTQTAQQYWVRVQSTGIISQELNRQWQGAQNGVNALLNAASR